MKGQSPQERAGARLRPLPRQVLRALWEQTARPDPFPGSQVTGEGWTEPAMSLSRRAGGGGLLARPLAAFLRGLRWGWWTHSQMSTRNSWGSLAPPPRQMQLLKAQLSLKGPRPGAGVRWDYRHELPFSPEHPPGWHRPCRLPPSRSCSQRGSLGRAPDGGSPALVPPTAGDSPACSPRTRRVKPRAPSFLRSCGSPPSPSRADQEPLPGLPGLGSLMRALPCGVLRPTLDPRFPTSANPPPTLPSHSLHSLPGSERCLRGLVSGTTRKTPPRQGQGTGEASEGPGPAGPAGEHLVESGASWPRPRPTLLPRVSSSFSEFSSYTTWKPPP